MLQEEDLRIDLDGEISATLPHRTYLFQREAFRQLLQHILAAHKQLERLKSMQERGRLEFEDCQTYRTIFICAPRGAGKSTFVRHLELGLEQAARNRKEQASRAKDVIGSFGFLPPVDPTSFGHSRTGSHHEREGAYTFLRLIIAHIMKWYEKRSPADSATQRPGRATQDTFRATNIVRKKSEELNRLIAIAEGNRGEDGLDGIGASQAILKLPAEIHAFAKEVCKELGVNSLVLPLDDVDMAAENGFSVLEALRNYLTTPYIQPIVTGEIELYAIIVKNSYSHLFKEDFAQRENAALRIRVVSAFITKIFPPNLRVTLRSPFDLLNENPIFIVSSRQSENLNDRGGNSAIKAVEFRLFIEVLAKIVFWKVPRHLYRESLDDFLMGRSLRGLIQAPLIFAPHVRQLGRILEELKAFRSDAGQPSRSSVMPLVMTEDLANMYKSLRSQRNTIYRDYSGYPILIEYLALCLMYQDTAHEDYLGHAALLRRFGHMLDSMPSFSEYSFSRYIEGDIKAGYSESKYPLLADIYLNISRNRQHEKGDKYRTLFHSSNVIILAKYNNFGDGESGLPGQETSLVLKLISGELSSHHRYFGLRRPTIAIGNLIYLIFSSFDFESETDLADDPERTRRLRSFARVLECFNYHEQYLVNISARDSSNLFKSISKDKHHSEPDDWSSIYGSASKILVADEADRSKWPKALSESEFGKKVIEWRFGEEAQNLPVFIPSMQMDRLLDRFVKVVFADPDQLSGVTLSAYLNRAVEQLKAAFLETSEPTTEGYRYQPETIASMIDEHPIVKMIRSNQNQKDLEAIRIGRAEDDVGLLFELFDNEKVPTVSDRTGQVAKKKIAENVARNINTLQRRAISFSDDDRRNLRNRLAEPTTNAYGTLRVVWPQLDRESKRVLANALRVTPEELDATYGKKTTGA